MDGFDDETEDHDESCPKCGHFPTRWARCSAISCDDGLVDMYDDDPIWYNPGDMEFCSECGDRGFHLWCPVCGYDIAVNPEHLEREKEMQEA